METCSGCQDTIEGESFETDIGDLLHNDVNCMRKYLGAIEVEILCSSCGKGFTKDQTVLGTLYEEYFHATIDCLSKAINDE